MWNVSCCAVAVNASLPFLRVFGNKHRRLGSDAISIRTSVDSYIYSGKIRNVTKPADSVVELFYSYC